jgi:hemolysin activation/secretion protein
VLLSVGINRSNHVEMNILTKGAPDDCRGVLSRIFCCLLVLAGVPIPRAHAQQAPDLSNIDRRIKESERRLLPQGVPSLPAIGGITIPREAVTDFTLSGVVVEGATALKAAEFAPLYEEFLATTVGGNEVYEILERVTKLYQARGFFLTRAVAPVQKIVAGVLRVRVIEGYVAKLTVHGDVKQQHLIERYAEPALQERPARLASVERALLLMNDVPGVSVSPTLKPLNADAGEYELGVTVTHKPIDASALLDNRGTPEVGRLQGFLAGSVNSVLGMGESLQASFVTVPDDPHELLYGSATAAMPIGNSGTYVSALGAYGTADPGGSEAALDSDIRIAQFIGRAWHPLIRSRDQNLWLSGAFDFRNFREKQLGQTVISDRLRTLRGAATYGLTDSLEGNNQFKLELSQGLGILGASDDDSNKLSRPDGHSQFFKMTANATRVQTITDKVSLRFSVAGQWAAVPLLSYEEFSLGGEQFGRAYDYGEVSGDDGIAASGELGYGGKTPWKWVSDYQLYGFYDGGVVWNGGSGSGDSSNSLMSAGAGFRLKAADHLRATFEAAKPITRDVSTTGDKDWRFFFSTALTY